MTGDSLISYRDPSAAHADFQMSQDTDLLREIRDLLLVMPEPALAKRDERLRQALHDVIGRSKQKAAAVLLMDGTRSQTGISKEAGIDQGALSRCIKALRETSLIGTDENQNPRLVISVPANFFESS